MLKAVLLDLDGTLLGLDSKHFVPRYIQAMIPWIRHLIPAQEFPGHLLDATWDMMNDQDGSRTNEEAFMESFFRRVGCSPEQALPIFHQFYREGFPLLQKHTAIIPGARRLVEAALAHGLDVVIATNPVYPAIAIQERIRWAGLDSLPFRLVTSYEHMHYCKPHRRYFEEVLRLIGCEPSQALMVGNDGVLDMSAKRAGLKTFFMEPFREKEPFPDCLPDYEGDLETLAGVLAALTPARP